MARWWQLKYFWNFYPYLGKIPILTIIFFRWVVQPPTRWKLEIQDLILGLPIISSPGPGEPLLVHRRGGQRGRWSLMRSWRNFSVTKRLAGLVFNQEKGKESKRNRANKNDNHETRIMTEWIIVPMVYFNCCPHLASFSISLAKSRFDGAARCQKLLKAGLRWVVRYIQPVLDVQLYERYTVHITYHIRLHICVCTLYIL